MAPPDGDNDDGDNKRAKFQAQNSANDSAVWARRCKFYLLLSSLIVDAYTSQAATLSHLTMWSWTLHLLYFELHLPCTSASSSLVVRLLHGPSMGGSFALFAMYVWTLIANPSMEFDLAPKGRSDVVIVLRAAWLHAAPVLFHLSDLYANQSILRKHYAGYGTNKLQWFWSCLGGYFAMGLTWEQINGDAAATYNVTIVDSDTYVAISKVIGVLSCVLSFWFMTKPSVLQDN
jgi:hypothetical protein